MTINVLLSPAVSGKTDWAVTKARDLAAGLRESPRLVVPNRIQVFDCKKRLASKGGALGVDIITFEELAWQILEISGRYPVRLSENNQGYLLKGMLQGLKLDHYNGIKAKPGFTQKILETIRELKAGGIQPKQFAAAVKKNGGEIRLSELADIYQSYQDRLGDLDLIDPIGAITLAGDQLEMMPQICADWGALIVDGFDDLSPVQLRLLISLSKIVQPVYLTLTGGEEGSREQLIHKRFLKLMGDLSLRGSMEIKSLGEINPAQQDNGPLGQLRNVIFTHDSPQMINPGEGFSMVAVPDREAEVRTALRWLKNLSKEGKVKPENTAIIMRSQEPYRSILSRIAREYDLTVRIQGGLPLVENPLISSILALLRAGDLGEDALNWRDIIENWNSPYFNWDLLYTELGMKYDIERHSRNGNLIKFIAHWGSIVRGYKQWEEVFSILIDQPQTDPETGPGSLKSPTGITVAAAKELWGLINEYSHVISPPDGKRSVEDHVSWLEDLLGFSDDDEVNTGTGLNLKNRILTGTPHLIQRDWKAFQAFSKILEERVWSSRIVGQEKQEFSQFQAELTAVVEKSSYQPLEIDQSAITCADISEVRGLRYEAVALLGMGEGEFPASIKEDTFLRDMDRAAFKQNSGLPLQLSTVSAEAEYFYESICRPTNYLLITRPRIADNGAPWQASPYWEEIRRRVNLVPGMETSRSKPAPGKAASQAEYYEILAAKHGFFGPDRERTSEEQPEYCQKIILAREIINSRIGGSNGQNSEFNGGLSNLKEELFVRFSPDHVWSSSRLETYQSCPYNFFISSVLNLDKPEPPKEGLDARQLGNIYHHILENLYLSCEDNHTLDDILAKLPEIAQDVFAAAPSREGFRETAWWKQTSKEILDNVERSIIVLETLDPSFKFYRAEQKFGIGNQPELHIVLSDKYDESYNMRGFIDRVDKNESGELRIIDYKTSGSYGFNNRAIREGKKLQLPIYALAAQRALGLGKIREGFYFHVRSATPSPLKLSTYREGGNRGPSAAMERSMKNGFQAVKSIQAGKFQPKVPEFGCPEYCPATGFCGFYQPIQW
jgi:ATP-dependent helicase/DNAse subunit B